MANKQKKNAEAEVASALDGNRKLFSYFYMAGYSTKIRKQIEREELAARRQWALENSAFKYVLLSPLEQDRDGVAVDGRGRRLYAVYLYAPMVMGGGWRLVIWLGDDDEIEKTYRTEAKARLAFDNIRDFIRRKTLFGRWLKYM